MRFSNQGRYREQVRFLRRQFLQDGGLPFGDILADDIVSQAMTAIGVSRRIRVSQPGFQSKCIVVVTTFLDPLEMTKEDLAFLYRARWDNELDLRSIKITLQMDEIVAKRRSWFEKKSGRTSWPTT
jgi:hypothetical protein